VDGGSFLHQLPDSKLALLLRHTREAEGSTLHRMEYGCDRGGGVTFPTPVGSIEHAAVLAARPGWRCGRVISTMLGEEAEMVNWNWRSHISAVFLAGVIMLTVFAVTDTRSYACTAAYVSSGGHILVGNNEDALSPFTQVWVLPREEGKHGRVYIGYNDFTPQGGVNEKGLWFDCFSADPIAVPETAARESYAGDMHDKIMSECATVEEALALIQRYRPTFLEDALFMFGDRSGASAIVEMHATLRRQGAFQICTNFRQSEHPSGKDVCERYAVAEAMLKADPEASVSRLRALLANTHVEGTCATVYSYIYDFEKSLLYVYHFHNYENVVVFDVTKELAKGKHTYSLTDVFPRSVAAEDFASHSVAWLEAKKAARRYAQFDANTYPQFAGRYLVSNPASMAGVTVVITAGTDRLYAQLSSGGSPELIPESANAFAVYDADSATGSLQFQRDRTGRITGFIAKSGDAEIVANRTE